jgi:putative acetyltransferase
VKIILGNLDDPQVIELLRVHVETAMANTACDSAHALGRDALRRPDIEFWAVWDGDHLSGIGALKELPDGEGEIKSMHVAQSRRRRGAGSLLLRHLIERAVARPMCRVSLETGSWEYFQPARDLYRKHGFVECASFAGYAADPNSIFMSLDLTNYRTTNVA